MTPPFRLALFVAVLLVFAVPASAATVWFVDNTQPNGSGSEASPFATLAAAEAASGPGDAIFVRRGNGPYRGGITLKPGQALNADPAARPVIEAAGDRAAVTCAGPAVLRGIALRAAGGPALAGGGGALQLDDVTIDVAGAGDGIVLKNHAGSLTVRGGRITGAGSGAALQIEGESGEVTFEGTPIERTAGPALVVRKRGGAIAFGGGSPVQIKAAASDAILVEDSAAAIRFADLLTITTAGARGIAVKNGGRLSIAAGSVDSVDAAAVELRGADLDVTLARVSASGAFDNGLALERTTGRFTVAGGTIRDARHRGVELRGAANVTLRNLAVTGSAAKNGQAPADCAADLVGGDNLRCNGAVVMHDVENVTLDAVRIDGSGQLGISGHNVRGAAFRGVTIDAAGDELHEHGIVLEDVSGEIVFSGCTIRRPASRAIFIASAKGDAAVTIENCKISDVVHPLGMQAVLVISFGSSRMVLTARGNSFTNIYSSAMYVAAEGKSRIDLVATGNTFEAAGGALNVIADRGGQLTFDISKNSATGSTAIPISVASGSSSVGATMSGAITANKLSGARCGGCTGISVKAGGTSVVGASVTRNEIERVDGSAIWAHADGRARLDVAVETNLIREPAGSGYAAIRVQAGAQPADTATVCARIGGAGIAANQIAGAWDARGAIQLVNRTRSTLRLPGLPPGGAGPAAFVRERNGGAAVRLILAAEPRPDAIVPGAQCSIPEIR
jgi:Right handed beta helix region